MAQYLLVKTSEHQKLRDNQLLCDTLTVDLVSITHRTFYSFGEFASEHDLTISLTLEIILCEVVVTNSSGIVVNNAIQLVIVILGKILSESDRIVEIVDVHTTGTM